MRTSRSKAALASAVMTAALALTGCSDAADTEVEVPAVDVPETITPGVEGGEGGEGVEGGEGGD